MYGAIAQQMLGAPQQPQGLDPLWQQAGENTAAYQQLAANAGAAGRGLNQSLFDQALRTNQKLRKDAFKQERSDRRYNIMSKLLGGGASVLGAALSGGGGDVEPSWADV